MKQFGQTIKNLRHKANMTQEKLAELLSISPQAISRWETDAAMPDISLLPPLANIFGVTTDHLLGMDTYQKDSRKAEFDEAFHQYWQRTDKEKNYQIAIRAVAEYPNNMEYLEWLASSEYFVGMVKEDDDEYTRLLESAVKHYKTVLDNSKGKILYNTALHGLVLSLSNLQKKQEAKEYAMLQQDEEKRDDLLIWCLEGDELTKHCQRVAIRKLDRFLFQLDFKNHSLEVCEAIEKILYILFPDGNFQYFHSTLQYNCIAKAHRLCIAQQYDNAIEELKKARYHAEEMTKVDQQTTVKFTSPLFNLLEFDWPPNDSDVTSLDEFFSHIKNADCFDPIKEREDFKKLLEY